MVELLDDPAGGLSGQPHHCHQAKRFYDKTHKRTRTQMCKSSHYGMTTGRCCSKCNKMVMRWRGWVGKRVTRLEDLFAMEFGASCPSMSSDIDTGH